MTINTDNDYKYIGEILTEVTQNIEIESSSNNFIQANTVSSTLDEVNNKHIIPVFVKENEPAISHGEFIDATFQAIKSVYPNETVLRPSIRLSHAIKGRIPEARNKAAIDLLDSEKTIYYERMAFCIEIPTISSDVGGNKLNLTIGGVKSYSLDSLTSKNSDQHFKVFIGFKNTVCTNLCINTDGLLDNLKVRNTAQLYNAICQLLFDFNAVQMTNKMQQFLSYELTESQFAHIVGRTRIYRHMPDSIRKNIPELGLGDAQINNVCQNYFNDNNFNCSSSGSIDLWRFFNLLTGANKSSYIDSFLERNANAFCLTQELLEAIEFKKECWYLN